MLRASAAQQNFEVDLRAVTNPLISSKLPHGEELIAFADAVLGTDEDELAATRRALHDAMGAAALVQVAAIAGNFSMNDRAANAIGIVMESMFFADSAAFRSELGIDRFPSARNALA